jgi:hypothetical protein
MINVDQNTATFVDPMQTMGMSPNPSAHVSRINSFNTFDGTPHSNLNDRTQFENVLNSYLLQRNSSIQQIPPIGNHKLDIFVIFHLVLQEGGFEIVCQSN